MKAVVQICLINALIALSFAQTQRPLLNFGRLYNNDGRYFLDNSGAYNGDDGRYHPDDSGRYYPDNSGQYSEQYDRYQSDVFGSSGQYHGDLSGEYRGNPSGQFSGGSLGASSGGASTVQSRPKRPFVGVGRSIPGFVVIKPVVNAGIIPKKIVAVPTSLKGKAAGFYNSRNYAIIRKVEQVEEDGYHYLYETENGILGEEQGKLANRGTKDEVMRAHGYFTYTGPDNVVYTVRYTADENGFVPQGAHLPTPPPVPDAILRSLAYQKSLGKL